MIQKRLVEWIVSSFDALGSGFEPDTYPLNYCILTPFRQGHGPSMLQAEPDTELTLSASPAIAVSQLALTLANWRYSTVLPVLLSSLLTSDIFEDQGWVDKTLTIFVWTLSRLSPFVASPLRKKGPPGPKRPSKLK